MTRKRMRICEVPVAPASRRRFSMVPTRREKRRRDAGATKINVSTNL
jgi:hypothetical protein